MHAKPIAIRECRPQVLLRLALLALSRGSIRPRVRKPVVGKADSRPGACGKRTGHVTVSAGGHWAMNDTHLPVLFDEAIAALAIRPNGRYLDGTFGRGGHARAILARLGPAGRLLLMDRDPRAIAAARTEFAADHRVAIAHSVFSTLGDWSEAQAGLDGVLLDLGVSSPQLDDAARGFSFMADGPLDMRMDDTRGEPVSAWLAHADECEIADVLWRYGEEKRSRAIARAIVAARTQAPIKRTAQLAELIAAVPGTRDGHKHPATRSFQALRMHINDELGEVERGLAGALHCLKPGGRLAVISFHSLEDRIVKQFVSARDGRVAGNRRLPLPTQAKAELKPIARIMPGEAELARNPRARSAILRVAEKLP
jgi:16S rRNA (cytosine1402-N4)-methyltransferase